MRHGNRERDEDGLVERWVHIDMVEGVDDELRRDKHEWFMLIIDSKKRE